MFHFLGGCFKCGATDHIARECEERSSSKQQGPKYVLKDDQTQHGGDGQKRSLFSKHTETVIYFRIYTEPKWLRPLQKKDLLQV